MHCCCCCCAAVVLSYLFWCFVLCGSVNYRQQSQRGEEREWETKSKRERAKGRETSAISAFPAKWSKQFAIDFFVCYFYSFFYNFNFNYTNAVRTKEGRKKKKQETRKIKIANWRRRQRNATQRSLARRSTAQHCRLLSVGCLFLSAALLVFLFS